ncbi:MAG: PIN/TRAM domain-containing protein [Burkholderiales bacterium]|nr:PIN/TRAM domain-containing protein [Phycisphaerae bacterium]
MTIFLTILRGLFILVMAAIGWGFVIDQKQPLAGSTRLSMAIALTIGLLALFADIVAPARRKLALFAGSFFGLVVGVLAGYALSFVVGLIVAQLTINSTLRSDQIEGITAFAQILTYCVATYFSISFVLQTKDDFRFIIPYVEFRKQTRGSRPILLDTSALIDGRIVGIAKAGVFEGQFIVPRFVLIELQAVADSPDRLKRNRGRRGLDMLAKLQDLPKIEVITYDAERSRSDESVDQQLMRLATELEARVLTTDFNLDKVAQLAGIDVININQLASQMKPDVLPGERLLVRIVKPGESANQGVGYMDDGTMVVVEQARQHLNEEIEFVITNTVQTNAGKMIFGRLADAPPAPRQRVEKSAT